MTGPAEKYPWDIWFSMTSFTVYKGVDYECSNSSMFQQIRNKASKRGIRVRISDRDDHIVVVVRKGFDEKTVSS